MAETAEVKARRKAVARAVERRRRAVAELRLAGSMCAYAADQLANGLSAEDARLAAIEAAAELVAASRVVRRAAWLGVAERRVLALHLRALGLSTQQIGDRVGVSEVTVRKYLHGRYGRPGRR